MQQLQLFGLLFFGGLQMRLKIGDKLIDKAADILGYILLPITYPLIVWRDRKNKDKPQLKNTNEQQKTKTTISN